MLNALKFVLPLMAFFIVEPGFDEPDGGLPCDGNRVGLCDSKRCEILPAKFSEIEYVGHGLFMAWSIDPADRFVYGKENFLFNRNGKQPSVRVPDGTRLKHVFWLGERAEKEPDLELEALPEDALLRFAKGQKQGLCNAKGEVVLPAEYDDISKVSEGKAFVVQYDAPAKGERSISIFDCPSGRLTELSSKNLFNDRCLHFSDGLAAINQRGLVGYIDEHGRFVISPQYREGGAFRNGMALVKLSKGPYTATQPSVVIDKSGKIVSPGNLCVQEFYGDFAVARDFKDEPPRYGVVNRSFKFVVEPKYASLSPSVDPSHSKLDSPSTWFAKTPTFYCAALGEGQPQELLSVTGKPFLKLPQGFYFNFLEESGLFRCWVPDPNKPLSGKMVYLNLSGERVSRFEDAGENRVSYRRVAPDRSLKVVNLDDGRFDPDYWKRDHKFPTSRREMFGRFLKDHNLIGLSREEVLRYLGDGETGLKKADSYWYLLEMRCCIDRLPYIVVQMKDDKAQGWCLSLGDDRGPLITSNVTLDDPKDEIGVVESNLARTKPK